MGDEDCEVACQAWTTKIPKAAQPNLNYMGKIRLVQKYMSLVFTFDVTAPEILHKGSCASHSDMYSLGMVYIACFTGGQSVIQASHSTNNYFKLAGQVI